MKSDLDYIKHIHDEIKFISEKSKDIDHKKFIENEILKRAFIRSIEIIGEASNKLSDSFRKKYNKTDWKKLSATRNRLIHGYFVIDYDIVWDLVENKIPSLESEILFIIESEKNLFD